MTVSMSRGRLARALVAAFVVCLAASACSPAPQGSRTAPTAPACSVSVSLIDGGPNAQLTGTGYPPDQPATLTFSGPPDPGEPFIRDQSTNPALHSDVRGVIEFFQGGAERANIGTTQVDLVAGGCTASTTFELLEAMFPPACPAGEPVASGGAAAAAYEALVMADEPAGYWRFEDLAGPLALATVGQPGAITGDLVFAQAGVVDGSRSLVLGPKGGKVDIVDLVFAGDVTIEGWLSFCDDPIDSEEGLFAAPGGAPNLNFFAAAPRFWTGDTDLIFADNDFAEHARWYHIALVRSNGVISLIVDGDSLGDGAFDAPLGVDLLGDMGGGNASVQLDEIAVYDHALTLEDLAERLAAAR